MSSTAPPKNFINDASDAVSEMIKGMLIQYPNKLVKLANHNVLLSSNIDYDKVNIISGGGSGHEREEEAQAVRMGGWGVGGRDCTRSHARPAS